MVKFLKFFLFFCFLITSLNIYTAEKADSYNSQGVEFGNAGQYEEAQKSFDEAAEIYNNTSARALHNKAYVLEIQGNITEAIATYKEAIKRNPNQVSSLERLGFWEYKSGNYAEAVEYGEKVLKLDPTNKAVLKWLPDAYRLKLENPPKKEEKEEEPTKEEENKSLAEQASEDEKADIKVPFFMISLDAGIRMGYDVDGRWYPFYINSPGKIINIPYNLNGWYKAGDNLEIVFRVSHPFYGVSIPNVISQEEFVEARLKKGKITFGGGILLSHYYDDIVFRKTLSLNDYKFGGMFSYSGEEGITEFTMYSKFLPPDFKFLTLYDNSLDTNFIQLKHTYVASDTLSYYTRVSSNGFYFYDHKAKICNYWGFVEMGLGITLDNKNQIDADKASITFELNKRFVYESLNNDKPYSLLNGQGFMGFDLSKKGGSYFSSYKCSTTVIRIIAEESLNDKWFLKQSFEIETVGIAYTRHEFLIKAGAGLYL